jgi:phosphomannomutase
MAALAESSGVKFGTSGARGLVRAMTDEVCYGFTAAFLQSVAARHGVPRGAGVAIAGDLRPSTPRIVAATMRATLDLGYQPLDAGFIPTPAVTLAGMTRGLPSLMVTGSHIPADRNGIKFNKPTGEILKADELDILGRTVTLPDLFDGAGMLRPEAAPREVAPLGEAGRAYVQRMIGAYPAGLLAGKRIGVYGHSAVGREMLVEILGALGAEVVRLGWSEAFIPVDTEAIRPEDVVLGRRWAQEQPFFAIVSTDGDSDRPLVGDESGEWFRGDVAGVLCARYAGADVVVTPVSSNTAVEKSGWFRQVVRTRIGSPFVIEAMERAVAEGGRCVVGYEANGGFLSASTLRLRGGTLSPLPTRDAVVVILSILALAAEQGVPVSALRRSLPPRFTSSNRIKDFPTEHSLALLAELATHPLAALGAAFEGIFGEVTATDQTDGLRITFASSEIVHLRASGNAPELRCYAEAISDERAQEIPGLALALVQKMTKPRSP